jgi:hypothetical protein
MADKDTSTNEDLDTSVDDVETGEDISTEDEIVDNEDQEDSGADAESGEDDDSDDDSDEDEEDEEASEFKKAFSTILGDTPEEYIPNLEEAYRKSSREGKKLAQEKKDMQERLDAIAAAVANNPDLAKALTDATSEGSVLPTADPALTMARQNYEEKVQKDLDTFLGSHPDLESDEELADEFMENVAIVGAAARKKGKILDPMIAYKKAWGMLGVDDSKEKLANAAKNNASKSKTKAAKKTAPTDKAKLTAEQIAFGKKMGLTEKQLLDQIKSD